MQSILHNLALSRCPGLFADRHFTLAALAALPFWLLLWGHPDTYTAPLPGIWPLLYLIALGPFVEELAFRGALQGWCLEYAWAQRRTLGLSHANLLVTALFCASHFAYHPPLWAIGVAVPSLIFGHLRERHHSLIPGLLLHVWYNSGYLLVISLP